MSDRGRKTQPHGNLAVSSIVGTVLLLLIAVSSFTLIYLNVLSDQGPAAKVYVDIVGTVEGKNVILEHRGGESLDLDTEIRVTIGGEEQRIIVGDNLDYADSANGQWDLGERVIIPFEYDIDDLDEYMEADVMAFEGITNSLAFMGKIELHPNSDIGIEISVEPDTPVIESDVTITVTATCLSGDVGAVNIEVQCLLPQGLIHVSNSSDQGGNYVNSTGIWTIPKLDIWETATLTIHATVTTVEEREYTQTAIVLDGSGSIDSADWNTMRTGLQNAIKNESVFPRDGSVELTVIQFGDYYVDDPHAKVELSPTVITESNYNTIANQMATLTQLGAATPMGCGLRLATDQLHDVGAFDNSDKQIVILVTDGAPNCEWIPGTYYGIWRDPSWYGFGPGKTSALNARNYLLSTLEMDPEEDALNALAVLKGSDPPDLDWLNESMAWPQPGYFAPPFNQGSGWVSSINNWEEFESAMNEIFNVIFNTIRTSVQITKLQPSDPNSSNDRITASILPQDV